MKSYILKASLLQFCLVHSCYGAGLFSSLPQTLFVTASPNQGQVLKAGEDRIKLSWGLNQSLATVTDGSYKDVKVKLCYAPISQVDRAWRKTVDNLSKDKTCQFTVAKQPYRRNQSLEWKIGRDVPKAVYFVRAYVYDSAGDEVAYGQTTNDKKNNNLFEIEAVSGGHLYLDISSASFSIFALVSLVGFFLVEKSKNKTSTRNS